MGISIPALAVGSTAGLEGGGLGALFSGLFGGGAAAAGAGAADAALGVGAADAAATGLGADAALGVGAAADAAATGLIPGSLDTLAATGGLSGSLPAATGGVDLAALSGAAAPAAASATNFAAPAGVASPLGTDPTAAFGADSAALPANATPTAFTPTASNAALPNITPDGLAATPTGAPTSSGGFLDTLSSKLSPGNIASGIGDSITKNPLGLLLAGGGLGYNILQGKKQTADVQALEAQAGQQAQTGAQLEGYLTSGTLPPGLQASVSQATAAAKANAISNAAGQGLSTDPTKNTSLAETLANIDAQVPVLTAQLGQQLLTSGITASGLSSNIYEQLANLDATQTQNIGKSIASMAAALSGKTAIPGTTLNISSA